MPRTDRTLEEVEGDLLKKFYAGEVEIDLVADLLGEDVAVTAFLLRRSVDEETSLPDPNEVEMPSDEEFYDGEVPTYEGD